MTLLFVDGFDVGDFQIKGWTYSLGGSNTMAADTTTPYTAGRSVKCHGGPATTTLTRAFTASSQFFIGFWFRYTGSDSSQAPICSVFGDSGTTLHLQLRLTPSTGTLDVARNTTTLGSAAAAVAPGNWYFIEWSGTINDSTGATQVKVTGTSVLNLTSQDTKNGGTATTVDAFRLLCNNSSSSIDWYVDDLYIANSSGSVNNTFLGPVRVQSLRPSGAGTTTQLTPTGSGTNWQNVDDVPYDTATYNASATSGQRDTYALEDLAAATATVLGVQTCVIAHASDAGAVSLKPALRSGGTVYYDSTTALSASAATLYAVREQDPATSAAWTVSNVNALEAGAEVA